MWVSLVTPTLVLSSYFPFSCGSGFGIGLWIMECRVVLMNATDLETIRGCFLAAPYLDEFSESDPGLR